jgi:DNA repair protein RecN (Recombination protein N)
LAGLEAEATDIASELRAVVAGTEADARGVEELEARLGLLYGLLRKHGDSEEAVLAAGEAARAEADRLKDIGAERARRATDDDRLRAAAEAAAERLSAGRRAAAGRFGPAVAAALEELGFTEAGFEVGIEPTPIDATGADEVVFRLRPNPGEPVAPLSRIASGGELSRVALAIKSVAASADATPTLVFDEVDAGIGGRSADPVGRMLWRLARDHQVLCVTHLPQIAAHADDHLRIHKEVREGRTVTAVTRLDEDERIAELAAMLGGSGAGTAAMRAAEDLLAAARARRSGSGARR